MSYYINQIIKLMCKPINCTQANLAAIALEGARWASRLISTKIPKHTTKTITDTTFFC